MVNRWLEKETDDDGCGMVFGDGRRSPTTRLNGSSRVAALTGHMGCGDCAIAKHISINKLDNALDDIPLIRSTASTKNKDSNGRAATVALVHQLRYATKGHRHGGRSRRQRVL